jgi:hypothetical protein
MIRLAEKWVMNRRETVYKALAAPKVSVRLEIPPARIVSVPAPRPNDDDWTIFFRCCAR